MTKHIKNCIDCTDKGHQMGYLGKHWWQQLNDCTVIIKKSHMPHRCLGLMNEQYIISIYSRAPLRRIANTQ